MARVRRPRRKTSTRGFTIPWRPVLGLGLLGAGVILTGLLGWYFLANWSLFRINRLEIKGLVRLSQEEVLKTADIGVSDNIFAVDVADIGRRLEAHPWISRAFVYRRLPDTLVIKIEEEVPVALTAVGGRLYLTDSRGRLFKVLEPKESASYPVINGVRPEMIIDGRLSPAIQPVLKLLADLRRPTSLLPVDKVSEILIRQDELVLITKDKVYVTFTLQDLEGQYQRLEKILAHLYNNGWYREVAAIRLDYPPGQAAVQFKGS